jgi:hypothetical protein
MRERVVFWSSIVLLIATGMVALRWIWADAPREWSPWEPLDVAAPPNLLTRYKLARVSGDARRCRETLQSTSLDFEPLKDSVTGAGCGFTDAVLVRRTSIDIGEEVSLSCRTALSLALWERHVLQPAAHKYFGAQVTRIEHFGSYSCRNVYGRSSARRSRHATAEAWDVAGFVLADGRRIRVARDWQGTGPAGAFLREVRDGACQFFDGVLSPDYNAAHRDHLHLDRGPHRMCR